jgi:hypothetical protein
LRIKTLYLPGFSHYLNGSRSRKAAQTLAKAGTQMGGLSEIGGRFLPDDMLSTPKGCRERVFTTWVTFWAFLSQVLDHTCSCREAVRRVQVWYLAQGLPVPDGANSAYCQARNRLQTQLLSKVFTVLGQWIKQRYTDNYLWVGHRVKIIDGTGMSMPDTKQNRRQWPYAGQQKPGCGFPVAQMVGVFCLGTGRLVKFALSTWKCHEIPLARQLVGWVHKGEILLADRGFCGWGLIALFQRKGVPVVLRLHQARRDKPGQTTWKKPQRPQTWGRCLWRELPDELTMRIVRFRLEVPGFRTHQIALATTLLDSTQYPDHELIALYMRRWRIELFYRDIKITLGLDILRCLTPQMVEKEIWMQAIAYNMIRALMLEAAFTYAVDLERLSFKGTCDTLRSWLPLLRPNKPRNKHRFIDELILQIASEHLPLRPLRSEPRTKKRRPKNYQSLTKPRHLMLVSPSRHKK